MNDYTFTLHRYDHRAICNFAIHPGAPVCADPATLHMLVHHDIHGMLGLASCDDHAHVARQAGNFLMEHRHAGVCGLPASLWDPYRNRCVLDDTGVEPARHEHTTAAA